MANRSRNAVYYAATVFPFLFVIYFSFIFFIVRKNFISF